MMTRALLPIALLSFVWITSAQAQLPGDVCCVMGKTNEMSAETRADIRSNTDCKPGSKDEDGYKVCKSKPDPDNLCNMMTDEERCKACGFFWAGKACLSEDPVAKAKSEYKEEEEKKKAAAEAEKRKPRTEKK